LQGQAASEAAGTEEEQEQGQGKGQGGRVREDQGILFVHFRFYILLLTSQSIKQELIVLGQKQTVLKCRILLSNCAPNLNKNVINTTVFRSVKEKMPTTLR
jgi:hypothetical protein